MSKKTAIIIGAGPAGLTAAYELLEKTDIAPIVLEASEYFGGISKTVCYKGNYIDIGGHRFFSKSDRVTNWWLKLLPLETENTRNSAEPAMLERNRVSHIYFEKQFFDYPLSLSFDTLRKLGFLRLIKIFVSYLTVKLFAEKKERTLEDFFINRFGRELYNTFFKNYTEKVWGVPCNEISAEWGVQRVKELSVKRVIRHALLSLLPNAKRRNQKKVETTLIDRFLYPRLGPGQLWNTVAEKIKEKKGEIHNRMEVTAINIKEDKTFEVTAQNTETGESLVYQCDYLFSSMAIKDLFAAFQNKIPQEIRTIANGLVYRDFITVGVLLKKLKIKNTGKQNTSTDLITDNWIYIQDDNVKLGRIQIFNNWSPSMVHDANTVWLGLEYFCNETDSFWADSDQNIKNLALKELETIDMADASDYLDSVVIRQKKAYPAYFGTYNQFNQIQVFTDTIENLFLIGRNGMHRYNNQDHSMLTAMQAVDIIIDGSLDKSKIWQVNTEQDYHEEK